MKFVFDPPQLRVAPLASRLRRLAQEVAPSEYAGELRVLQTFEGEPLRLVLIQRGRWSATIKLPPSWIEGEPPAHELRARTAELFHMAAKPVLAP